MNQLLINKDINRTATKSFFQTWWEDAMFLTGRIAKHSGRILQACAYHKIARVFFPLPFTVSNRLKNKRRRSVLYLMFVWEDNAILKIILDLSWANSPNIAKFSILAWSHCLSRSEVEQQSKSSANSWEFLYRKSKIFLQSICISEQTSTVLSLARTRKSVAFSDSE